MGKAKKKAKRSIKRKASVKVDLTKTPIQLAKEPAGKFMAKFDMLLRDKVKGEGTCGRANQFLREEHEKLFGSKGQNTNVMILKARVCYELMAQSYKVNGVEDQLPRGFRQNHEAALRGRVEDFTPGLRELVKLRMRDEDEGGKKMKKKVKKVAKKVAKKTAAGKTSGGGAVKLTASSVICDLYWNNNKTKYSDEKILKLAKAKLGKLPASYTAGKIGILRSRLNAGKVAKYGKPKKQIESFN